MVATYMSFQPYPYQHPLLPRLCHPNPHFLFTDPSFPLLPSQASCLPSTAGENQITVLIHSVTNSQPPPSCRARRCPATPLVTPGQVHVLLRSAAVLTLPILCRRQGPTPAPRPQKTICLTCKRKEGSFSFLAPS